MKSKFVCCSGCNHFFGRLVGESTLEIKRLKHRFVFTGKDWSIIGNCPKCWNNTSVICKDGKIDVDNLKIEERDSEQSPAPNPNEDPENPPKPDTKRKFTKSDGDPVEKKIDKEDEE